MDDFGSNFSIANTALARGHLDEAERACQRCLSAHPESADALALAGHIAHRRGALLQAVTLWNSAIEKEPGHLPALTQLGIAMTEAGNWNPATEYLRRALELDPGAYRTRLYLGAALEGAGQAQAALFAWFRALSDAQADGRWLDQASTESALRPRVRQALRYVNEHRRDCFMRVLDPLFAEFGRTELSRVHAALLIWLGDHKAEYADPRQRPSFFYLPGLPASPYLPREAFSWIAEWEAASDTIRSELKPALDEGTTAEAVFHTEALAAANLRSERGPARWDGLYFYRHGQARQALAARCPQTRASIDRLPLARIREHAPECLYSVLTPGTHLLPHRGVTNTRLVAHLPLIVPPDCALRVAGETHVWQEGRAVVFDDTYEHEAWNGSQQTRVVLICDIWNPHLSETERAAVTRLIEAIGDFRKESSQ